MWELTRNYTCTEIITRKLRLRSHMSQVLRQSTLHKGISSVCSCVHMIDNIKVIRSGESLIAEAPFFVSYKLFSLYYYLISYEWRAFDVIGGVLSICAALIEDGKDIIRRRCSIIFLQLTCIVISVIYSQTEKFVKLKISITLSCKLLNNLFGFGSIRNTKDLNSKKGEKNLNNKKNPFGGTKERERNNYVHNNTSTNDNNNIMYEQFLRTNQKRKIIRSKN
eukprot:gene6425-4631_t